MKDEYYSIVRRLCATKSDKHIVPAASLYSEISAEVHKLIGGEVKEALNELIKDGKLSWFKTSNQVAFQIRQ